MLIRLGYDIQFELPAAVAMVALLNVHPLRAHDLLEPDELTIEPNIPVTNYIDSFGNRCSRGAFAPEQFNAHSRFGLPGPAQPCRA
jgi:hypothetical protein